MVTLGGHDQEMNSWEVKGNLSEIDYIAVPDETFKEGLPVNYMDVGTSEEDLGEGVYDLDPYDGSSDTFGEYYDEESWADDEGE